MSPMKVGRIGGIRRYPVKSMAGASLDVAAMGWHGILGDRRLAFRRLSDQTGFPWLTAGHLPSLLLYKTLGLDGKCAEELPTRVLTPDGRELDLRSAELREEVSCRYGSPVELMNLRHGVFDDACVSIISLGTLRGIQRELGRNLDPRRFRPNIVIDTNGTEPFEEDRWLGRTLVFGEEAGSAAVRVTLRDERCVIVNLDPDTAERDSEVMKTVARLNQNCAGVYGTVVRVGELRVGQIVSLES